MVIGDGGKLDMKWLSIVVFLLGFLGSQTAFSRSFPNNSLRFPVGEKNVSLLTENDVSELAVKLRAAFLDDFKKMGKTLNVEVRWDESRVDAYATRDDNDNAVIVLFGGMIRHPLMTRDAVMAVLCHELGHYMGGAPRAHRGQSTKLSWASTEGQADYFATSKCMRRIYKGDSENENLVAKQSIAKQQLLKGVCQTSECSRSILAGEDFARVYANVKWESEPAIYTPDPTKVSQTYEQHGSSQCRLDTFVAGAKCQIAPQKQFDPIDATVNACTWNKSDQTEGARPRCWYAPR